MNCSLSCLSNLVPKTNNVSILPLKRGVLLLGLFLLFLGFLPVCLGFVSVVLMVGLGVWLLGVASGAGFEP